MDQVSRMQTDGGAIRDDPSSAFILMSCRFLVFAITLTLIFIPWSEHYSRLDTFPRGEDSEFSLLASLVILGIILLLVRSGKKRLRSLLVVRYLLLAIIQLAASVISDSRHVQALTDPHHPPLPALSLGHFNIPLQI